MQFDDLDLLSIGNTVQLTGAIYSGDGWTLLCMFPDSHMIVYPGDGQMVCSQDKQNADKAIDVVVDTLNMTLEEWEHFLRQTDLMETEVLIKAGEGASFVKAILRKSSRQISQQVSWAVYRRDGYACRYCGNDKTPLTVDHLILWKDGGPSVEVNLVSCCRKCNRKRGDTPYGEWLDSPYYKQVSQKLSEDGRLVNRGVIYTLQTLPRVIHKHSHR